MQQLSKAELKWISNMLRNGIKERKEYLKDLPEGEIGALIQLDMENLEAVQRKIEAAINGNDKRIEIK